MNYFQVIRRRNGAHGIQLHISLNGKLDTKAIPRLTLFNISLSFSLYQKSHIQDNPGNVEHANTVNKM